MPSTADLLDEHPDAQVCALAFRSFGGRVAFEGPIATVRCPMDNVRLRELLGEPGDGRVAVVDGGGSGRVALLGDRVAGLGVANGWAGIVVNGMVRDAAALRDLPIGILALGTCPRPSAKAGAGEIGRRVVFGEVTFEPGDLLCADGDGVVVLPAR
ncbi:MAG TPA: ribonuclease E activity regulator RraA [Actinomycetota bacterium]|nr:ribonuclease E activity regulator RraA [Actinomycetota bacterium]